jgi:hypothetical protein
MGETEKGKKRRERPLNNFASLGKKYRWAGKTKKRERDKNL